MTSSQGLERPAKFRKIASTEALVWITAQLCGALCGLIYLPVVYQYALHVREVLGQFLYPYINLTITFHFLNFFQVPTFALVTILGALHFLLPGRIELPAKGGIITLEGRAICTMKPQSAEYSRKRTTGSHLISESSLWVCSYWEDKMLQPLGKRVWRFFKMLIIVTSWSRNSTSAYIPRRNKNIHPPTHSHMNTDGRIIYNSHKVATMQMSINK